MGLDDKTRSLLGSNGIENVTLVWSDSLWPPERAACQSDGRLIGHCTSLKRLQIQSLSDIYSRAQIEGFELVLRGIADNRSIEELRLDGYGPVTTYSPKEAHEFANTFAILSPLFEHNHNFRRLQLDMKGGMFAEGTRQLALAIEKCSSLKEFQLYCSRNDAESFGGDILTALKNSKSDLTKLSLDGCYSGWNACAELGELIKSSPLEELDLSQNSIDDEGGALLGRVLGKCPTLKTLVLCSINVDLIGEGAMTPAGWRDLFKCLKSHTCALEELELQWGHTDDTALALADALETNTTLKTLKFWNNFCLTPNGWCSFFANVLGNPNSALEHLNCSRCASLHGSVRIIDDGIATALADALVGNKSLRTLDLTEFESIGLEGRQTIESSVQTFLFNKKSLGAVISSNHTLSELCWEDAVSGESTVPVDLVPLLQLNQNDNKERIVEEKVLRYYNTGDPTIEDDELLVRELTKDSGELEIKVMPFVLAWAGSGDDLSTLLYRLIRRDPAVFGSAQRTSLSWGNEKDADATPSSPARGYHEAQLSRRGYCD